MYLDDVSTDLLTVRHDDTLSDLLTPTTYDEAMRSRYASRWRESMDVEIKDLLKHDTWELVTVGKRHGSGVERERDCKSK